MTVRNGDLANETTFNNAFMSRIIKALGVGIEISSTTEFSRPYPIMTTAQRDAITPSEGDCLYNSDSKRLEIYDGTQWGVYDNVDSVNGKTGVVVLDKTDIGLENVDNTSDLDKPISTATQNALDLKADELDLTNHVDDYLAHREIDTKANLETWALTAPNGAYAFATDEKLSYQVIDTLLSPIGGGGGGGLDEWIALTEYEVGDVVWLSTDNKIYRCLLANTDAAFTYSKWKELSESEELPSTYKLFNAENRDLTSFTNISINTTAPINGLADYSVDAYPASLPDVPLFPRNLNKRNTLTFEYTITSGTAKVAISGGGLLAPVELELDNTKTRAQIEFAPTSLTDLSIDITDVASATGLKIDDLVFSDEAREVKNFTKTETITYTGFLSKGAGDYVRFKTELENSGSEIISVDNSGDRTTYTLLKDADVIVSSSLFSLDAVQNNMKIEVYDIGNALVLDGISRNEYHGTVSLTIKGKAGYFFLVDAEGRNPSDVLDTNFSIQATATASGTVYASDNSYEWNTVTKFIAASTSTGTGTAILVDLNFTDLKIGKKYLLNVKLQSNGSSNPRAVHVLHGGRRIDDSGTGNDGSPNRMNFIFTATATTIEYDVTQNTQGFFGDGTERYSFAQLTELPDIGAENFIIDQFKVLTIDDGVVAPAAIAGKAQLYVDNADGDLKVIFGNGTVKTIATNP